MVTSSPAGYSGTPLSKKLGLASGMTAAVLDAPAEYRQWLGPVADDIDWHTTATAATQFVHVFVDSRTVLARRLGVLRRTLTPAVPVWVSWPKQSAKVPTDIVEGAIREVALPLGYVDVKVCAVSPVWSGLKLVVRKELR